MGHIQEAPVAVHLLSKFVGWFVAGILSSPLITNQQHILGGHTVYEGPTPLTIKHERDAEEAMSFQ